MTAERVSKILADGTLPGVGALAPLVAATASPKGIWILAGGATSYHGSPAVLFSADGRKFSKVRLPQTASAFNVRSILALDDKRIFVGGQSALFSSINGGKAWKEVKGVHGVWSLAQHDGRLWACGNGKVARSDDSGKSWKTLAVPRGGDCYGLAVVSRDEAYIADDGKIHRVQGDKVRVVHQCAGVYVSKIARSPDGMLVAVASKGQVFTSTNGTDWTTAKVAAGRDYMAVMFQDGHFLIGGSKGTLLELTPGRGAREIPTGLSDKNDQILGFVPMGKGTIVLAGRDMDASMKRRGVAIGIGDLRGAKTPIEKPVEQAKLPPPVKRKQRPGTRRKLTDFERCSWKEAKARFKGLATSEATPTEVRVYPSMRVADLDLSAKAGQSLFVIVDGNLHVDGVMTVTSCEDDDTYVTVHVTGNLSAQSLALSLDPRFKIAGDVEVEDVISCGAGRAFIDVGGAITCRLAMAVSPGRITVKKGLAGMAIGEKDAFKGVKTLAPAETAFQVLRRAFVDAETSIMKPLDVAKALRKGVQITI